VDYLEGLDDLVLPVPGHSLGVDDGRGDALLHTGREPSHRIRVFFKFVEYLFEYISTPHRPLYRRERWVYKKDKNNNKHSNKSRVAAPDPDKS